MKMVRRSPARPRRFPRGPPDMEEAHCRIALTDVCSLQHAPTSSCSALVHRPPVLSANPSLVPTDHAHRRAAFAPLHHPLVHHRPSEFSHHHRSSGPADERAAAHRDSRVQATGRHGHAVWPTSSRSWPAERLRRRLVRQATRPWRGSRTQGEEAGERASDLGEEQAQTARRPAQERDCKRRLLQQRESRKDRSQDDRIARQRPSPRGRKVQEETAARSRSYLAKVRRASSAKRVSKDTGQPR